MLRSQLYQGIELKKGREARHVWFEKNHQTERTTTTANTWQGSNISAGSLNLSANNNLAILASDINVDNNADIKAENILVGGRDATTDTTHDSITKTKTLTVGVKNAYVDVVLAAQALKDAKDAVSDAKNAYNDAKQKVAEGKLPASDLDFYKVNLAAATANVASATTAVYASGATVAATGGTGFYASAGATTQTDTTSTTSTQGTWNGSNINVGNNANLTSNNNLNIEGSNINTAGQLVLNAENINITAGKNTYTENTESHSEGGGISVSIQPTTTSFSGSVNASQSRSDYQSTDYVNSQIGAGSLVSNSDNLTIKGGNVSADEIDITTGGLTVESLQNTSSGSSSGAGFSVSASLGGSDKGWEGNNEDPTKSPAASGVTGFGGNASKGNSEKAWVAQQSGITGGTVNITAKDTSLTGAVIAAVDEQGDDVQGCTNAASAGCTRAAKLTLTTGTLTVADLQDSDNSKSMGMSISGSGNTTTIGANFNGHEKAQTNKATVGLGNVTVGGTNIDEQAQFADLNRDAANSQETTKDMERGGLDMSLTVDNRMLSEAGWEDIANDVEKTNTAVVDGVDYVADEIAVMGDNLPEELRGTLGDKGEVFYDSLIRGDVSSKLREAIIQDPALLNMLMTQNELDSLSSEEKANLQADFVSKIDDLANQIQANKENAVATADDVIRPAAGQTAYSDNEYTIAIEINSGSNDIEPTVLEKAVAGIGKAQQAIMALEESNPQAAEAIRIGLGLATGGPVKEAVSYTVEKATEVVANMSETAQQALAKVGEASDYLLNLAGSFIQGSTLDEFKGELADETQYPEAYSTENGASLGSSPTDIKDGVVLTASTLGIGAGLGSIKKASSHGSDGADSSGSMGSGPEGNAVNANGPRDEFIGPYNPNNTRADLEAMHGADNVTSTTNPNNPVQTANSNPDKGIEVIHGADGSKAVRVQYNDPVTSQPATANIPYNDRGLPVFDDHAKYTTNIDHSVSYQGQMRQATRDLRDAINSGKVDASQYTPKQLQQIQSGSSTIENFTWHHNADSGNMQLMPKDVHNAVRHTGQGALNQGK